MNGKDMKKMAMLAIAVVLCAAMTVGVMAATYEPGSENDPVVTLSYVEGRLAGIMADFQEKLQALETPASSGSATVSEGVYEVVFAEKGSQIYFADNTQVILRSGALNAIANASGDGLADLTAGKDLKTGNPVEKNHLLLVPRNDGRGVSVLEDAWIMINGRYTLQ